MIYETDYRRKALASWEKSKEENKKELSRMIEKKRQVTNNPFVYLVSSITAWLSQ